LKKPEAK